MKRRLFKTITAAKNFTPPPQPLLNIKKDVRQGNPYIQNEPIVDMLSQIKPQEIKQSLDDARFSSRDLRQNHHIYSNYNQSYKNALSNIKNTMVNIANPTNPTDDKLMEKINYMLGLVRVRQKLRIH